MSSTSSKVVCTTSTLPTLSVRPCGPPWRVGKYNGAHTAIGPSQSPSCALATARPVGRASALDFCPGAKVSRSQTDLLIFRYLPVLLGGKGMSLVGWDTGNLPSQGKNCGHRTPPGPCVPHGGTPEAPQHPLTPSGLHALRAGVWRERALLGTTPGFAARHPRVQRLPRLYKDD
jgi:hypothetical protein